MDFSALILVLGITYEQVPHVDVRPLLTPPIICVSMTGHRNEHSTERDPVGTVGRPSVTSEIRTATASEGEPGRTTWQASF